jgi:hypothetical protein
MAHSGLLLKTKDGRYFICEYGVENDKNKTSIYEVNIKESNCDKFYANGKKWNKQICGTNLEKQASIQSIKETMENASQKHSYSMLFWNCHMMQETTREKLGLKVENKYLEEKYREEWNLLVH